MDTEHVICNECANIEPKGTEEEEECPSCGAFDWSPCTASGVVTG